MFGDSKNQQRFENTIEDFINRQWLVLNKDGSISLPTNELYLDYFNLMKDLSQSYIDAYYLVGLVLKDIN